MVEPPNKSSQVVQSVIEMGDADGWMEVPAALEASWEGPKEIMDITGATGGSVDDGVVIEGANEERMEKQVEDKKRHEWQGCDESFNQRFSHCRILQAHTCSWYLEVSTCYRAISEFHKELDAILVSPDVMHMNFSNKTS